VCIAHLLLTNRQFISTLTLLHDHALPHAGGLPVRHGSHVP
jgi:hypothetical protein